MSTGSDLPPWCRAPRRLPGRGGARGLHVYPTQSPTVGRGRLHTRGSRSTQEAHALGHRRPTHSGRAGNARRGDEVWSGRLKARKRDCRAGPVLRSDSISEQSVGGAGHSQPRRSRPRLDDSSMGAPPALTRWLPTLTELAVGLIRATQHWHPARVRGPPNESHCDAYGDGSEGRTEPVGLEPDTPAPRTSPDARAPSTDARAPRASWP
jgi:hypothetical protein